MLPQGKKDGVQGVGIGAAYPWRPEVAGIARPPPLAELVLLLASPPLLSGVLLLLPLLLLPLLLLPLLLLLLLLLPPLPLATALGDRYFGPAAPSAGMRQWPPHPWCLKPRVHRGFLSH